MPPNMPPFNAWWDTTYKHCIPSLDESENESSNNKHGLKFNNPKKQQIKFTTSEERKGKAPLFDWYTRRPSRNHRLGLGWTNTASSPIIMDDIEYSPTCANEVKSAFDENSKEEEEEIDRPKRRLVL